MVFFFSNLILYKVKIFNIYMFYNIKICIKPLLKEKGLLSFKHSQLEYQLKLGSLKYQLIIKYYLELSLLK